MGGRIALFLALTGWAYPAAAQQAPSLRTVLTAEEFQKAGLDKLSEAELAFLSQRVLAPQNTPAAVPIVAPASQLPALEAPGIAVASTALPPPAPTPVAGPRIEGEAAFGHEEKQRREAERERRIPTSIESSIAGIFRGWSGRTVFALANGQVWQQTDESVFSVNLENPRVTIEKGALGAFYLRVESYGSRVKVRRIK